MGCCSCTGDVMMSSDVEVESYCVMSVVCDWPI